MMYSEEEHYLKISDWFQKQGLNPIPKDYLPALGWVSELGAAVFLYETNSKVCFIDNFICDPNVRGEQREKAIQECQDNIIEIAKIRGFKLVLGYTLSSHLRDRAQKLGWKTWPEIFHLVTKEF